MKRRTFIKKSAAASMVGFGVSGLGATTLSASKPDSFLEKFTLNFAPHLGMFSNHAGTDPIDQIHFMADQGFTAFEDNNLMKRSVEMQSKIGEALAKRNMTMGVFVIQKGGNLKNTLTAGKQKHLDIFLDGCRKAVEVAKRVDAKWLTVVPGAYQRRLPIGIQDANVIDALRRAADILAPHDLSMVLEPLSDSPELYLQRSDHAYMLCKAVDSPACKILFDIYHLQKTEGNIITNIDSTWDEIAYFQIGDNPGRKEPTTGEINYKNVFKHIHKKGFKGVLGMEHRNSIEGKQGELAVINAYRKTSTF